MFFLPINSGSVEAFSILNMSALVKSSNSFSLLLLGGTAAVEELLVTEAAVLCEAAVDDVMGSDDWAAYWCILPAELLAFTATIKTNDTIKVHAELAKKGVAFSSLALGSYNTFGWEQDVRKIILRSMRNILAVNQM